MAAKTFEKALEKLEQIVQELETGNLTLEKSVKKFEEGIALSKYCSQKLDETEKRITILLKDGNNQVVEESFVDGLDKD